MEGETVREVREGAWACRSLLFVPGDNPSMVGSATLYRADAVILDLEDSVPLKGKAAARILVREALGWLDRAGAAVGVRINAASTGMAADDLTEVMQGAPDFVMVPKVESAGDVADVCAMLDCAEDSSGVARGSVGLLATIETPPGVVRAYEIACASPRIVGLGFGAEDFRTAMGIARTEHGQELLLAKSMTAMCAKAAGVAAFDTVYSNVDDEAGFLADVKRARELGFSGKFAIHPGQIRVINSVFAPDAAELERARKIVEAYEAALRDGIGVVTVDGAMVDEPVVRRAYGVLAAARGGAAAGDQDATADARGGGRKRAAGRPGPARVSGLVREGEAGTDRKGDVIVKVAPAGPGQGTIISVESTVAVLYGPAIEATVRRVLADMGVADARVSVADRGALDFAVAARAEAAVRAAARQESQQELQGGR